MPFEDSDPGFTIARLAFFAGVGTTLDLSAKEYLAYTKSQSAAVRRSASPIIQNAMRAGRAFTNIVASQTLGSLEHQIKMIAQGQIPSSVLGSFSESIRRRFNAKNFDLATFAAANPNPIAIRQYLQETIGKTNANASFANQVLAGLRAKADLVPIEPLGKIGLEPTFTKLNSNQADFVDNFVKEVMNTQVSHAGVSRQGLAWHQANLAQVGDNLRRLANSMEGASVYLRRISGPTGSITTHAVIEANNTSLTLPIQDAVGTMYGEKSATRRVAKGVMTAQGWRAAAEGDASKLEFLRRDVAVSRYLADHPEMTPQQRKTFLKDMERGGLYEGPGWGGKIPGYHFETIHSRMQQQRYSILDMEDYNKGLGLETPKMLAAFQQAQRAGYLTDYGGPKHRAELHGLLYGDTAAEKFGFIDPRTLNVSGANLAYRADQAAGRYRRAPRFTGLQPGTITQPALDLAQSLNNMPITPNVFIGSSPELRYIAGNNIAMIPHGEEFLGYGLGNAVQNEVGLEIFGATNNRINDLLKGAHDEYFGRVGGQTLSEHLAAGTADQFVTSYVTKYSKDELLRASQMLSGAVASRDSNAISSAIDTIGTHFSMSRQELDEYREFITQSKQRLANKIGYTNVGRLGEALANRGQKKLRGMIGERNKELTGLLTLQRGENVGLQVGGALETVKDRVRIVAARAAGDKVSITGFNTSDIDITKGALKGTQKGSLTEEGLYRTRQLAFLRSRGIREFRSKTGTDLNRLVKQTFQRHRRLDPAGWNRFASMPINIVAAESVWGKNPLGAAGIDYTTNALLNAIADTGFHPEAMDILSKAGFARQGNQIVRGSQLTTPAHLKIFEAATKAGIISQEDLDLTGKFLEQTVTGNLDQAAYKQYADRLARSRVHRFDITPADNARRLGAGNLAGISLRSIDALRGQGYNAAVTDILSRMHMPGYAPGELAPAESDIVGKFLAMQGKEVPGKKVGLDELVQKAARFGGADALFNPTPGIREALLSELGVEQGQNLLIDIPEGFRAELGGMGQVKQVSIDPWRQADYIVSSEGEAGLSNILRAERDIVRGLTDPTRNLSKTEGYTYDISGALNRYAGALHERQEVVTRSLAAGKISGSAIGIAKSGVNVEDFLGRKVTAHGAEILTGMGFQARAGDIMNQSMAQAFADISYVRQASAEGAYKTMGYSKAETTAALQRLRSGQEISMVTRDPTAHWLSATPTRIMSFEGLYDAVDGLERNTAGKIERDGIHLAETTIRHLSGDYDGDTIGNIYLKTGEARDHTRRVLDSTRFYQRELSNFSGEVGLANINATLDKMEATSSFQQALRAEFGRLGIQETEAMMYQRAGRMQTTMKFFADKFFGTLKQEKVPINARVLAGDLAALEAHASEKLATAWLEKRMIGLLSPPLTTTKRGAVAEGYTDRQLESIVNMSRQIEEGALKSRHGGDLMKRLEAVENLIHLISRPAGERDTVIKNFMTQADAILDFSKMSGGIEAERQALMESAQALIEARMATAGSDTVRLEEELRRYASRTNPEEQTASLLKLINFWEKGVDQTRAEVMQARGLLKATPVASKAKAFDQELERFGKLILRNKKAALIGVGAAIGISSLFGKPGSISATEEEIENAKGQGIGNPTQAPSTPYPSKVAVGRRLGQSIRVGAVGQDQNELSELRTKLRNLPGLSNADVSTRVSSYSREDYPDYIYETLGS